MSAKNPSDCSALYMYIETVAVDRGVIKKAQKLCFLVFPSHLENALPVPIAEVECEVRGAARKEFPFSFLYMGALLRFSG